MTLTWPAGALTSFHGLHPLTRRRLPRCCWQAGLTTTTSYSMAITQRWTPCPGWTSCATSDAATALSAPTLALPTLTCRPRRLRMHRRTRGDLARPHRSGCLAQLRYREVGSGRRDPPASPGTATAGAGTDCT